MLTICFLNMKGGTAKTSSTFHLSGTLSRAGDRVLLIDNDPQASLTQGFFGPDRTSAIPPSASVAALYRPDADVDPESVIIPTGLLGVDMVPGSLALADSNVPRQEGWGGNQWGLREFLAPLATSYDLCLIDCPPNLHLCSWSALVASTHIVVPLQAEDFGSQGLAPVQSSIDEVRSGPNPGLDLAGYLLSMFDKRLAVHLTYEELLRDRYGPLVFGTMVPRAKDFVEAVAMRKPVAMFKPKSAAAQAIASVAAEMKGRIGFRIGQGRGAA